MTLPSSPAAPLTAIASPSGVQTVASSPPCLPIVSGSPSSPVSSSPGVDNPSISHPVSALDSSPSAESDSAKFQGPPSPTLKFFPPQAVAGDVARISPPPEVIQQSLQTWKSTLLGSFSGKGLNFHAVANIARRLWHRFGLCHVAEGANGLFLFRFSSDELSNAVLARAPWTFKGIPLFLKHWLPGMPLVKEQMNTFPIWIRLRNVPADFWTPLGLSWISSAVGKPLHLDPFTAKMDRLHTARVCVDVSPDSVLPSKIFLNRSANEVEDAIVVEVDLPGSRSRGVRSTSLGRHKSADSFHDNDLMSGGSSGSIDQYLACETHLTDPQSLNPHGAVSNLPSLVQPKLEVFSAPVVPVLDNSVDPKSSTSSSVVHSVINQPSVPGLVQPMLEVSNTLLVSMLDYPVGPNSTTYPSANVIHGPGMDPDQTASVKVGAAMHPCRMTSVVDPVDVLGSVGDSNVLHHPSPDDEEAKLASRQSLNTLIEDLDSTPESIARLTCKYNLVQSASEIVGNSVLDVNDSIDCCPDTHVKSDVTVDGSDPLSRAIQLLTMVEVLRPSLDALTLEHKFVVLLFLDNCWCNVSDQMKDEFKKSFSCDGVSLLSSVDAPLEALRWTVLAHPHIGSLSMNEKQIVFDFLRSLMNLLSDSSFDHFCNLDDLVDGLHERRKMEVFKNITGAVHNSEWSIAKSKRKRNNASKTSIGFPANR